MYVVLTLADGSAKTYTKLNNLSYAPEIDLTLSELRVDEFSADIVTTDEIKLDGLASLYDDLDQLWARYFITDAKRIGGGITRVTAQSAVGLMDRWKLGAEMFQNVTVSAFVAEIFSSTPTAGHMYNLPYSIDADVATKVINGFCPEQTARERLQWLCIAAGCVAMTAYREVLTLVPLPVAEEPSPVLIPINQTFDKPDVNHKSRVASLRVTSYDSFTTTEPSEEDSRDWQNSEDYQGRKWYYLPSEMIFENEALGGYLGDEPTIDGVTLLGADDVLDTLSAIAPAYFARDEVTLDIINNREYAPGDRVIVYVAPDKLVTGYIQSASFKFGLQARSTLTLLGADEVIASGLTIRYMWGDVQIGRQDYVLPLDYQYSYPTAYIDMAMNNHRYVFRPEVSQVTGTIEVGDNEATVNCLPALEYAADVLTINAVDDITTTTEDDIVIGVIA